LKKAFTGQIVRHIGAWNFVVRSALYQRGAAAQPKYLDLLRSKQKTQQIENLPRISLISRINIHFFVQFVAKNSIYRRDDSPSFGN